MAEFEHYYKEIAGVPTLDDSTDFSWEQIYREVAHPNDVPVRVHGDQVIPHGGTYSDMEMLVAIEFQQIMQYPHDPSLINAASIDFRLGNYFYTTDRMHRKNSIYDPHDQDDVDEFFGEVRQAEPLREIAWLRSKLGLTALKNIDPDAAVILLRPGERILAHTFDFMGISIPGIGQIFATSTKARNGITIAQDSTFLNPGWKDRLTLEIKNENEHEHVPLVVGDIVGQTVYHSAGPTRASYQVNGSYSDKSARTHAEIVSAWHYTRMKPRAKLPKPLPAITGLAKELL